MSWGEVGGSGTRKELIQYFHHQLKILFIFLVPPGHHYCHRTYKIIPILNSLQKKIGFIQNSHSEVNWHYLRVTVPGSRD